MIDCAVGVVDSHRGLALQDGGNVAFGEGCGVAGCVKEETWGVVDWCRDERHAVPHYVKVDIDRGGGNEGEAIGVLELRSVSLVEVSWYGVL